MCVVSMIFDHFGDKWGKWVPPAHPAPTYPVPMPYPVPVPAPSPISPEEVEEFRKLLERAREYDRAHSQPDCELEEKRKKVKELAEMLGIKIDFV
jgi:hypothetical protein